MRKIRVLVVEDSLTVRKYLVEAVNRDPDFEVISEAEDGKQAIELCERLRPDVVTMDIMLPVLSGLTATEYIMAYCPTPILIVSSSLNRGEVYKTYDALSAGAVDVIDKPSGDSFSQTWDRQLLDKLRVVSRIRVITHPRAKFARPAATATSAAAAIIPGPDHAYDIVAIGASTGGPAAVLDLLSGLPPDFPLPILLVIHIGDPFGLALCDWLDGLSPLRVSVAADGQSIPKPGEAGRIFMAPHSLHMVVRHGKLRYSDAPERHSCRPSVDVLFESVAREYGPSAIACLMTGMGRDGAAGMLAIKQAGGQTLAQDEASSVVFGMPREAIQLGAANHVLPLDAFAPTLRALAAQNRPAGGEQNA